ncbi:acetate--CoA ligase family protein [Pleurocapsales cyanobacterium LEGE 06147]|nr:acetate--CoA ligase family protein [Pleurocapsales cyanobacterium LEGE 06147]
MDLLEYQAKELFREVGIPVLPSQTIKEARELKQLQIPYPVVLKSQVRVGGRGKAGGIRFVANTIDAIAAARNIFNLAIFGEYPEVLLAEARYNAEQEFFLAVVLDYQLQRPVLLGSSPGGMNVEALLENLQQVVVEAEFSPFYARRLTLKMGLAKELIRSVSAVIEKMYRLFIEKDLDLIEINPLGVSPTGELMALDGKISVNDYALARHPDILALTVASKANKFGNSITNSTTVLLNSGLAAPHWLDWREEKGNIAIICNSLDLALISWDLLCQGKGRPACCAVVDDSSVNQQLPQAIADLEKIRGVKVILINILAEPEINQSVARIIADYLQTNQEETEPILSHSSPRTTNQSSAQSQHLPSGKLVLRLLDQPFPFFPEELRETSIFWTDSLEEAVSEAIALAKSR